jgi:hypothetical protein
LERKDDGDWPTSWLEMRPSSLFTFAGRQVDEGPVIGEPHLGGDVLFEGRLAADLQGLQTLLVAQLER